MVVVWIASILSAFFAWRAHVGFIQDDGITWANLGYVSAFLSRYGSPSGSPSEHQPYSPDDITEAGISITLSVLAITAFLFVAAIFWKVRVKHQGSALLFAPLAISALAAIQSVRIIWWLS